MNYVTLRYKKTKILPVCKQSGWCFVCVCVCVEWVKCLTKTTWTDSAGSSAL